MFRFSAGDSHKRRTDKNFKARPKRKQDSKMGKGIQLQSSNNLKSSNLKTSISLSEVSTNSFRQTPPFLELTPNPSQFTVYAAIRQCVLEKRLRQSALAYNQTFGQIGIESEAEDEDDEKKLHNFMKVCLYKSCIII